MTGLVIFLIAVISICTFFKQSFMDNQNNINNPSEFVDEKIDENLDDEDDENIIIDDTDDEPSELEKYQAELLLGESEKISWGF